MLSVPSSSQREDEQGDRDRRVGEPRQGARELRHDPAPQPVAAEADGRDDADHGQTAAYVGAEGGGHRRGMVLAGRGCAAARRAPGIRQETPVPARPQYPFGHLVEVLLVVLLGVVEGRGRLDLGRDRLVAGRPQVLVVGGQRHLRGLLLGVVGEVDARAVLGADVVALAHPLGRVVLLEEDLEQVGVGDLLRVEGDHHRLGVAGPAAADLLVGRVRRGPVHVADRGRVDAVEVPEEPLRAPEAAEGEVGDLDPVRERRLQRRVEHGVALGDLEGGLAAARQRLLGGGHARLLGLHRRHQLSESVHLHQRYRGCPAARPDPPRPVRVTSSPWVASSLSSR